jgi:SAM-dependent methyltransferase
MEAYDEILERVKSGESFLDLGCCFGQEIRQLVFDGAPSVNTYGSDLYGDFITIGYDLFKDKDRIETKFVAADVFDDSSPLADWSGRMNIIFTGAFFHLFSLEDQERAAMRVLQLLAPKPGSLLVGHHTGHELPGAYARSGDKSGRKHFRHNPQSWKELWDRVGQNTGSKWDVRAELRWESSAISSPEGMSAEERRIMGAELRYTVRRL